MVGVLLLSTSVPLKKHVYPFELNLPRHKVVLACNSYHASSVMLETLFSRAFSNCNRLLTFVSLSLSSALLRFLAIGGLSTNGS